MGRRRFFIFKDTHLPVQGWLQGCFICNSITGQTEDYVTNLGDIDTQYVVYLCGSCKQLKDCNGPLRTLYESQILDYILAHSS